MIKELIFRYKVRKFLKKYNLYVHNDKAVVSAYTLLRLFDKNVNEDHFVLTLKRYLPFCLDEESLEWFYINKDNSLPVTQNSKESVEALANTQLINFIK